MNGLVTEEEAEDGFPGVERVLRDSLEEFRSIYGSNERTFYAEWEKLSALVAKHAALLVQEMLEQGELVGDEGAVRETVLEKGSEFVLNCCQQMHCMALESSQKNSI
jgi:hypothetical protein